MADLPGRKTGRKDNTMAANVETMFYVREKPWHGLGKRVEEAPTSQEALELAGLDWVIEDKPIYDGRGNEIRGYKANTRSTDGHVMGIVSNRYKIVQNREAFDFTDALIGEGITYETAGSLRGGKQIWLLGKMPERFILGDKFEPYICFTNFHDGSGAVRACMTPVRVVCNNTLNMALKEAKRAWSTPHRGDVKAKLEEARQTLLLADQYMTKLDEQADKLANEVLPIEQVHDTLDKLFEVKADATDRQKQTAQDAKDGIMACIFAPDLVKFLGTKYGFINAVADYVGHSNPVRQTKAWQENRWGNIIGGHSILDKAVQLIGAGV